MSTICELELNGVNEIYEFEKVAKQSNGSVLYQQGDAVLLATVVSEFDNGSDEDFIPLTVQYIEKTYANAKFAGGFIKREGKSSDFETLTSRIIDRSIRPLFPKGYVYPTTITVIVLSVDKELDLQLLALKAVAAALYTSNLPIKKSVSAVRIGKIDDQFIVNPTNTQLKNSTLDLYISGTKEELLMIEMRSIATQTVQEVDVENFVTIHNINDIGEDELIEAISLASDVLKVDNQSYEDAFEVVSKEMVDVKLLENKIDEKIIDYIRDNFSSNIKEAIKKLAKSERSVALKDVATLAQGDYEYDEIYEAVSIVKKEIVRDMIVNEQTRADGRELTQVRPISIETNILPSAHSSCLFTRGKTQALVVATLGNEKDAQMYEVLTDTSSKSETFMVHYNFPGFSVGEAKPVFGVSRRELGHGNLAKRALESSIDINNNNTIRLVSEILESNGSSSMATVCGGSLALKAAGIEISSLIAGIAMGAVFEDDKYAILTDIMGLEDHDGDMDFKVAGTTNGITALQMDIKLGGIEIEVLKKALYQARDGRIHILELMQESAKSIVPSKALPIVNQFQIDPKSIVSVIGKAGSVIREIIEQFNVGIDLDRTSGAVKVTGTSEQSVFDASEHIKNISSNAKNHNSSSTIVFDKLYKVDDVLLGKVVRIADFGAFIELPSGGEGLLHISKISKKRVNNINDIMSVGDSFDVKVLKVSKDRIELGKADI
jgi:polyribonucleotide nucleotidyltransferase